MTTETVINFRCDKVTADRAKARFNDNAVKFPDLLRVAVSAIASGDTTIFNEILRESELNASGGINSAWLYYTCHNLFEYRDGQLYAKRNKGSRNAGEPVELHTHDGARSVIINGRYYPVKEVIWLMFYGHVSGPVISAREDSNRISDLEIMGGEHQNKIIFHKVTEYEGVYLKLSKQRAVIIDSTALGREAKGALIRLYKNNQVFYMRLYDDTGWRMTRSAIHAEKIGECYIVSIS
jgi:hypothetical protein